MTNSKISYNRLIRRVYLERGVEKLEAVSRAREKLPGIEFLTVDDETGIPDEFLKGTTLYLKRHRGKPLSRCPGSKGHLCCNYHTVDLYGGCGLGCTYCIMRSYLNFSPVTVYVDPVPAIEAVRSLAKENRNREVRVGTGEIGDSLLYDPIFELTESFVRGLSDLENLHFEMKTKTDFVDHLFGIEEKGNAIIGFSLNPSEIGTREEGISSPVESRISAAERAVKAGYRVSFHFDPVFHSSDWRELYFPLIDSLGVFAPQSIAWISLGTFRYTPGLKERIADRPYIYDEYVPSADGKYRYLQKVRVGMYKDLLQRLRDTTDAPVYLCMESAAVWKRVYGSLPDEIPALEGIFDETPRS